MVEFGNIGILISFMDSYNKIMAKLIFLYVGSLCINLLLFTFPKIEIEKSGNCPIFRFFKRLRGDNIPLRKLLAISLDVDDAEVDIDEAEDDVDDSDVPEDDDDSEIEEFLEPDDYETVFAHLSKEWLKVELNHNVSKVAANAYWKVGRDWFHRMFHAKELQNVTKKTPSFVHTRRKMHDELVPPINLEIAFQSKQTEEETIY